MCRGELALNAFKNLIVFFSFSQYILLSVALTECTCWETSIHKNDFIFFSIRQKRCCCKYKYKYKYKSFATTQLLVRVNYFRKFPRIVYLTQDNAKTCQTYMKLLLKSHKFSFVTSNLPLVSSTGRDGEPWSGWCLETKLFHLDSF